ncbi:unnamed protein product [Rhizophagus irregularis]|nr:unnamed protein product [Rhizophagus irregularis]
MALFTSIIYKEHREKPVPKTPEKYEELYKKCWSQEPRLRPTTNEILDEFKRMDFGDDIHNLTSKPQNSAESSKSNKSTSIQHVDWIKELNNTQSN